MLPALRRGVTMGAAFDNNKNCCVSDLSKKDMQISNKMLIGKQFFQHSRLLENINNLIAKKKIPFKIANS